MAEASAPGPSLELRDDAAGSLVVLAPARGAIVTRFHAGDRELLFLDESTLTDPTKNVRGGIPLLFPSPGRLTGDHFARDGHQGAMKQHGFARELPWRVGKTATGTATLVLESTPSTLAAYPWPS